MKIHVISTINGRENEGMRNVATHLAREWEKEHTVRHSGLKDIVSIVKNTIGSDAVVLFARAGKAVYVLLRLLCLLCANVWLVCVQKPDCTYKRLCEKKAPGIHYFTLIEEDLIDIRRKNGSKTVVLPVGINKAKFAPVNTETAAAIKQEFGFSPEKKLVVHVGHASAGRGLEQFAALTDPNVEKLVVVSGMFNDTQTMQMLQNTNVRILSEYLPNVEKVYQMADAYLFPTKSAEHVISIPLSVMEALSCGTPVAACGDLPGLKQIRAADGAVRIVSEREHLNHEIQVLCERKSAQTLLLEPMSWSDCAKEALTAIRGK